MSSRFLLRVIRQELTHCLGVVVRPDVSIGLDVSKPRQVWVVTQLYPLTTLQLEVALLQGLHYSRVPKINCFRVLHCLPPVSDL